MDRGVPRAEEEEEALATAEGSSEDIAAELPGAGELECKRGLSPPWKENGLGVEVRPSLDQP
jgi:hypothetical protein